MRFVDGQYQPIEIERSDLMMLLEGIDTGSVKRLKRYRRKSRNAGVTGYPKSTGKEVVKSQNQARRQIINNDNET